MTEPGAIPTWGTGHMAEVSAERHKAARERFDREVAFGQAAGKHVWVAIATFLVQPEQFTSGDGPGYLDGENLGGVYLGCYVCEEPYDPRMQHRRCRGDRSRR